MSVNVVLNGSRHGTAATRRFGRQHLAGTEPEYFSIKGPYFRSKKPLQLSKMAVNLVQKRFMSSALQKFCYNLAGFNKYGLWRDDLLYANPDVQVALKRLPQNVVDERNYRMLRATQLSIQKTYLPKEQWTKLEDDKLYLTPLVEDVIKERQEREEWNKIY
ncbi:unnamed protein product [Ceutorhynchus assimilis]|uniref:Cytochrome b-c1 complex subunit 7 n=1 Tax=Ceutorhynchus assimilis TaxID=467358 RepID=A0A9N9MJQ2_9CUCU|nr:unnamed protein product [Ceutorhynchus assimilis]